MAQLDLLDLSLQFIVSLCHLVNILAVSLPFQLLDPRVWGRESRSQGRVNVEVDLDTAALEVEHRRGVGSWRRIQEIDECLRER